MIIRVLIAGVALTGLTAFAPAPKYKEPKTPEILSKLKGVWEREVPERVLVRGKRPAGLVAPRSSMRVKIDGTKWTTITHSRGEARIGATYTMTLDTTKKPIWLDLKYDGAGVTGPTMKGIITIEGDALRFTYVPGTDERPTRFDSNEGRSSTMTLKRIWTP